MQPNVQTVETSDPNGVALVAMGQAAREAADTYTMREWASRLATLARPKDYVGQLEQLYQGIIDRWRYVQEHGEWVPGSARTVLGQVLGAKYNLGPSCPSPDRCDVERTEWTHKGWGDCDDVATLAAAGAISIGAIPFFRVARGNHGAHVSVTARTPKGELVELDPVGHPDHSFNWAIDAPGVQINHYDMEGRAVALLGAEPMQPMPYQNFAPQLMGAAQQMYGATEPLGEIEEGPPGTYMAGVEGVTHQLDTPQLAMVHPTDTRGPRVLAMPEWHARLFMKGLAWDGTPAIDQYGDEWTYEGDLDVWMPAEVYNQRAQALGYYGWDYGRRRRRGRLRKRLRKVGKRVKKVFRKVARVGRRILSKVLRSKVVQAILSRLLSVWGVPPQASRGLMEAAGQILKSGGIIGLIKLARKSPKKALKVLAKAIAKAGKAAALPPAARALLKGYTDDELGVGTNVLYHVESPMGAYYAAPVSVLAGCPGVYEYGALDVLVEPEPGRWYRVQKGDTLVGIAGRAFDVGPGGTRLKRAQWIDAAIANEYTVGTSKSAFAQKYFGPEIVKLLPRHSSDAAEAIAGVSGYSYPVLWIPPVMGMEPPEEPPIEEEGEPPPDIVEEADVEEEEVPPPVPPPLIPPLPPGASCASFGPDVHAAKRAEGLVCDFETGQWVPDEEAEEIEPEEEVVPTPPIEVEPAPEDEEPEVEPDEGEEEPVVPAGFAEACRATGGQPVYTAATGWGCVKCGPNEVWSDAAGKCIPVIAPTPTPTPPIIDVIPEEPLPPVTPPRPGMPPPPVTPPPPGAEKIPWPLVLLAIAGGM